MLRLVEAPAAFNTRLHYPLYHFRNNSSQAGIVQP